MRKLIKSIWVTLPCLHIVHKNGNFFGKEYDVDFSKKCNYKKCEYDCMPSMIETSLNENTLTEDIIADNINDLMKEIIQLYKKNYYYTLEDFINILKKESLLVFFALNKLLKYTGKIVDKNDNKGKIIYNNGYYIFVKKRGSKFVSINNIRKKNTTRVNSLNISRSNTLYELKKNNRITKFKVKSQTSDNIFAQAEPILKKFIKKNNLLNEPLYKYEENKSRKDDIRTISALIIQKSRYYLDFMPLSEKELLIKYIIIKYDSNSLSDNEKIIMKSLYNILYNKEDIWYEDIRYTGIYGEIWGYKIVDNKKLKYMKYNKKDKKFYNASFDDIKQIQKSFKKKLKLQPPSYNIIGYYELKLPQNTLVFKIRDKTKQGTKGTQIKTGRICDNDGMKIPTIIEYIETLLKTNIYSNINSVSVPNKPLLCKHLELILRFLNISDTNYRYFYGPEETIEYKLNKKII